MSEITPIKPISFACPNCKRPLQSGENALQCSQCHRTYPIIGGIPDPVHSECEIARTMKVDAPLGVQTFVAGGESGIMRLLGRRRDVHAFELHDLELTRCVPPRELPNMIVGRP